MDFDRDALIKLGAPEHLKAPVGEDVFYACRFLMNQGMTVVTVVAFTSLPRDPLTRGTWYKAGGQELLAEGFRPVVVRVDFEVRSDSKAPLSVRRYSYAGPKADEWDQMLARSGLFELQPLGPWWDRWDSSGEYVFAELSIDDRSVFVRRFSRESGPLSTVLAWINANALTKAVNEESPHHPSEPSSPSRVGSR